MYADEVRKLIEKSDLFQGKYHRKPPGGWDGQNGKYDIGEEDSAAVAQALGGDGEFWRTVFYLWDDGEYEKVVSLLEEFEHVS